MNNQPQNVRLTRSELKQRLSQLITDIAPEADIDALNPNDSMREELDLDSIDFIRLLTAIEKALKVKIPESDYAKVDTLNDMLEYIAQ
jgi:acyl carrier protein